MIRYLLRVRNNNPPKSIILMYHRINKTLFDPWQLTVEPDNFSSHLEILLQITDIVSLDDLIRTKNNRSARPRVAITFDDGYLDNYTQAIPILMKFNAPAVFYITTGYIDQKKYFWWEILQKIILENPLLPLAFNLQIKGREFYFSFEGEEILVPDLRTRIADWKAFEFSSIKRCNCFYQLWKSLKPLLHDEREIVIKQLIYLLKFSDSTEHDSLAMSSEQIKAISLNPLFSLGAHTVTHPSLTTLPKSEQRNEIGASRKFLEQLTCKPITTFAYPYGDYNMESINILKEIGFSSATTTVPGLVNNKTNPFLMGRFQVTNLNVAQFERTLNNWLTQP